MILVADCSALIALSVCDSLSLLEQLFAGVVVDIYLSPNLIATVLELAGEIHTR